MNLSEVVVDIVVPEEQARFRSLMQAHHYLGALPKIGETLWYVAHLNGAWLALAVFSAAALKCRGARRLGGLGLPHPVWTASSGLQQHPAAASAGRRHRNLGSRVLGLCARRIVRDWPARFGHPLLLLETFVDPARFHGTVYRAANWRVVGHTRGFRRRGGGYGEASTPKRVFLYPLTGDVRGQLSGAMLAPTLHKGAPKTMLSAAQMRSLPEFFTEIDDPRTRKGRRHPLPSTLALASAATLCGARGYKAIGEWVDALRAQSPRTVPGPAAQWGAQAPVPVHHPYPPDPRRPRTTRPRAAALAPATRRARRGARHRRQDAAQTPSTTKASRRMS